MSFEERAKALLLLKDSLGPFYDEQKTCVLEEVLSLPIQECAPILSSLVACQFITPQELSELLTRKTLTMSNISKPTQQPEKQEEKQQEKQEEEEKSENIFDGETTINQLKQILKEKIPEKAEIFNNLLNELENSVGITNISELLNLEQSQASFNILDELLSSTSINYFNELMKELQNKFSSFFNQINESNEKQMKEHEELRKVEETADSMIYNFHSADAKVLVIPCNKKFNFFASVELNEEQNEIEADKSQFVFFCLDISASMNHNEKGEYCAPKSRDHHSSSIKKARELIPQLALSAIQRYSNVYVIVWNYKVQKVIEFTPEMFLQDDVNEFKPQNEILNKIKQETSEQIFLAKGGTNMEAALDELKYLWNLHKNKMKSAITWFLTDGEETVYIQKHGERQLNSLAQHKMDRIPSNPNADNFSYFNLTNEQGITQYQANLLNSLASTLEILSNENISMDFHVCQFKDADPMFLRCMREASNGYFHTLVDVSNLSKELDAENSSSQFSIEFLLENSNNKKSSFRTPASINNGVLYARGELPNQLFINEFLLHRKIQLKINQRKNSIFTIDILTTNSFHEPLLSGVKNIIQLEDSLHTILMKLNDNVTNDSIHSASIELQSLRSIRMKSLTSISRFVRAGTILQLFLESILESVESQMNSLERLLAQFQNEYSKEFDSNSAKSNDLLTFREKMAISAGLESMKVRLGNGFVSKSSLDKRITHLIAKTGHKARKMLNRRCILVETINDDTEITWLSLFIIDGDIYEESKSNYYEKIKQNYINDHKELFQNENEKNLILNHLLIDFKESFIHHDNNPSICYIQLDITITNSYKSNYDKKYKEKIEFHEFFICFIEQYHIQVNENDLDESRKRFVDPLSYCSFIDLIQENNTLPAFLYKINVEQSIGLLFNAKELLYVQSGGNDATSFDYFRLFWRLENKKGNNNGFVTVPGTFSSANFALPMAPEPLTNIVLSTLMPGLLSEFITGTSMAYISGIILIYSGYLMMHLHQKPMTGVDISRSIEILSTIATWLDNPNTYPSNDEKNQIISSLITNNNIESKDSPGKSIPIKALIYCMLDDDFSSIKKHSSLQESIYIRLVKRILHPKNNINPLDLKLSLTTFLYNITGEIQFDDEIPVSLLNKSQELADIMNNKDEMDENNQLLTQFLNNSIHCWSILEFLSEIINKYETIQSWIKIQQLLYTSFIFSQFSMKEIQNKFKKFESTNEIEDNIAKKILKDKKYSDIPWDNVILSYFDDNDDENCYNDNFILLCYDNSLKQIQLWNVSRCICIDRKNLNEYHLLDFSIRLKLWKFISYFLSKWKWSGRMSNCFSLLDIDFDIVSAMKDESLVCKLSQTQLSEYKSAMNHKKEIYAKWAPKKEFIRSISAEENVQISMNNDALKLTGKPRLSMIVIGHVDAGKSTTTGHLILKRGQFPQHIFDKIEHFAGSIGKNTYKYAFVMDRLRAERERGISIESSLWSLETEKYQLDLIDAPGHRDFIKNMASGASLADAALLMVSAARGEFETGVNDIYGNTKLESLLAYTSGVRQFIIAVNKMDTVDYSEDRFNEIKTEVSNYLKKLGVQIHRQIFIPISGYYGDNLIDPSNSMNWFTGWSCKLNDNQEITGKTLLDAVDFGLILPRRNLNDNIRIPILKTYKISGVGTIATGRIVTGQVQSGQELFVMPLNKKAIVRTIESYKVNKSQAIPGDIIGVHLPGVRVDEVSRGSVLYARPIFQVYSFTARVKFLASAEKDQFSIGSEPYIFCHTASFTARIFSIKKLAPNSTDVMDEKPAFLKAKDSGEIVFSVTKPVCVEKFADCPPLGRFAIKNNRRIVGVGIVTQISNDQIYKPTQSRSVKQSKYFK